MDIGILIDTLSEVGMFHTPVLVTSTYHPGYHHTSSKRTNSFNFVLTLVFFFILFILTIIKYELLRSDTLLTLWFTLIMTVNVVLLKSCGDGERRYKLSSGLIHIKLPDKGVWIIQMVKVQNSEWYYQLGIIIW